MSSTTPRTKYVLGSRASKLAQIQTYHIQSLLQKAHPHLTFDVAFMLTGGDKNKIDALYTIGGSTKDGGKSLWTEELEVALKQERTIDFVVHSLKDVPTILPEGCEIGCIPERESALDSLVVKKGLPYKSLGELPDGSVVGTSSIRRVTQLKRAFPTLIFTDVRGNLDTRLAKLDKEGGEFTAIILAHAGLTRMNLEHRVTSDIVPPELYHAVGQGALGIEIRSDDEDAKELLKPLSDPEAEMRARAERACLRVLEGGCSVPVGVESSYSVVANSTTSSPSTSPSSLPSDSGTVVELSPSTGVATLTLTGTVTSLTGDNQVLFTTSATVKEFADAEALGSLVGHKLIDTGAKTILDEVNLERAEKAQRDAELKAAKAAAAATSSSVPSSLPTEEEIKSVIKSATKITTPSDEKLFNLSSPSKHSAFIPSHPGSSATSAILASMPIHIPSSHPHVTGLESETTDGAVCLRPKSPVSLTEHVGNFLNATKRKAEELEPEESPEASSSQVAGPSSKRRMGVVPSSLSGQQG